MTTDGKTFIREVPVDKLTDKMIKDYEDRGFELVYKDDSVEVWAK